METPLAIQITDLVKTFSGKPPVRAVDGINLSIGSGEIVALHGPNGAGKTTTLDMVLGLTQPSSGSVRVLGQSPREAVRQGRISAVLQTGGLLADLSVGETVELVASSYEKPAPIDSVLERAQLAQLVRRRVSKCSGGEQQRLRFALALLPDPDAMILDEPTAGMDVTARRVFWATMHAEAERGRTVVFATHYLHEADEFAGRIILVANGLVVADGSAEEVRARAGGRVITAQLPRMDAIDAAATLALIRAFPAVTGAEIEPAGAFWRLRVDASDSDEVARRLFAETQARELEITRASLDEAFVSITSGQTQTLRAS